jgi:hypothetical protein
MPRRSFTRPAIRASRSNFSAETSVCGQSVSSLQVHQCQLRGGRSKTVQTVWKLITFKTSAFLSDFV